MNDQQRAAMQMAYETLERLSCVKQTMHLLWWQIEARKPLSVLREALAQPQENTGRCGGCNKTAKDGWALYCVECWEKAQPQGEWVDLTWDDYLELAGQSEFYVKDPHTGVMEFCSHEFTKAVIAKFKEKNTPPVVPQGEPVGEVLEGGYEVLLYDRLPEKELLYTTPPVVPAKPCNWTQDHDDAEQGAWKTGCDNHWYIVDGSPSDNNMKFCHGCGRQIVEHQHAEAGEEK